jgi:hypothetical protein
LKASRLGSVFHQLGGQRFTRQRGEECDQVLLLALVQMGRADERIFRAGERACGIAAAPLDASESYREVSV